jgi:uncharacterized protein Veg
MEISQQVMITDTIHETLSGYVGQRLKIKANMGRSKIIESEGVLTQVHPALFIVEVDRRRGRTSRQSYQYVDVLTGVVELSQDGHPLFGKFFDDENEETDGLDVSLDEGVDKEAGEDADEGADEGAEANVDGDAKESVGEDIDEGADEGAEE